MLSATAQAGIWKADAAEPTAFLEHGKSMGRDSVRTPFARVWRNPSPRAWERANGIERIVILPVNLSHFQALPRQERADVEKMAAYMREQFQAQFARDGRYHVMRQPGPGMLQLELALVQLRPTNVPGNILSTGAGMVVPGLNIVGSQFTHGTIAFEARLRNAQTGELLAEYADRQNDKISPLSFRDYSAYAHSRRAVQDWARQMQELATTPRGHKVPGAMRVTFNPL